MRTSSIGQKKASLNRIILWAVFIAYFIAIILLMIFDWILIKYVHTIQKQKIENKLDEYVASIENSMDYVDNRIYQIWLYDDNFGKLSNSTYLNGEFNEELYSLTEELNNLLTINENIHGYDIFYTGEENSRYRFNSSYIPSEESDDLSRILALYNSSQQNFNTNMDMQFSNNQNHWITLKMGETPIMAVQYTKNHASIFGIYSMRKEETQLRILDDNAKIIYSTDLEYLSEEKLANKLGLHEMLKDQDGSYYGVRTGWRIYSRKIAKSGLWVTAAFPLALEDYINVWMFILLFIEFAFTLLFFHLLRLVKKEVIFPLRGLVNQMNRIRNGEEVGWEQRNYAIAELQNVNDTLSSMVAELKEQKLQNYENVIAKQKAIMQYLQLQLKPHFYLNGLKTLNALAEKQETQKIQELILLLAKNIRYLMSTNSDTVSLQEEITFCTSYMELRKLTTGGNVQCTFDYDKEKMDYIVPVLCIQTFLENSCKYANMGTPSGELLVDVNIRFLRVDGMEYLDIIIRDNGQGYSPLVLEQLRGSIELNADAAEQNIGINNIRRRCKILYGDSAELSFYNSEGAVSELLLPTRKENEV